MLNISTRKVRRNGLIFQVPTSLFSRFRFSVHPDGTGTSWTEDLDIGQPHGLDYRSNQDIRKGIRKRAEHEHSEFADATVGMKHLAGGSRILGIVENTVDLSTGSGDASIDITDGKFQGRGLIYDQTNNAFWCYTGDGTVSDDPYLLTLHPDRAWNGGDVTWAGAHQFDASVCFTDAEITGAWLFEGTVSFNDEVDFSSVNITGTVTAFGAWSSRNNNQEYTATTDGFVCAWTNDANTNIRGFSPTATQRAGNFGDAAAFNHGVTFPVRNGDTWKVTGATTVYWLPIGT